MQGYRGKYVTGTIAVSPGPSTKPLLLMLGAGIRDVWICCGMDRWSQLVLLDELADAKISCSFSSPPSVCCCFRGSCRVRNVSSGVVWMDVIVTESLACYSVDKCQYRKRLQIIAGLSRPKTYQIDYFHV